MRVTRLKGPDFSSHDPNTKTQQANSVLTSNKAKSFQLSHDDCVDTRAPLAFLLELYEGRPMVVGPKLLNPTKKSRKSRENRFESRKIYIGKN